jgi:uncharacterized cupredoxin-like copper-binding protein
MVLLLVTAAIATAAQAHGSKPQHAKKAPTKIEQTDWGIAGNAKKVKRQINITMADTMRFTPDSIVVKHGETVRITLQNKGALLHEFVVGTKPVLEEHAALMVKFPDMEHDEPYMAHVPPGQRGSIIWTFNRAGEFDFACLIAGHYQAGMVGKISVLAPVANPKKAAKL